MNNGKSLKAPAAVIGGIQSRHGRSFLKKEMLNRTRIFQKS